MAGILPEISSGGKVYRDISGQSVPVTNVTFNYSPSDQFTATCALTALPNDCSAHLTPEQVNAIVSEILCLGETFSPQGTWFCADTCNLSRLFNEWVENNQPDFSGYATEEYVDAKAGEIELQLDDKADDSEVTADALLAKIKTVDGIGSGLDADRFAGLGSNRFMKTSLAFKYKRLIGIGVFSMWGTFPPGETIVSATSWDMSTLWEKPSAENGYIPIRLQPPPPSTNVRLSFEYSAMVRWIKDAGLSSIRFGGLYNRDQQLSSLPDTVELSFYNTGDAGSLYPKCVFYVTNSTGSPITVATNGNQQKNSPTNIFIYEFPNP